MHNAAFERAGIVRVDTLNELFDCADMLAKQPIPKTTNLAIVTNTGGPGVMAVDHLYFHDIDLPKMPQATVERLNPILSPNWSRGNPADIIGDATPEAFRQAAEICMEAPEFDALLLMNTPQAQVPSEDRARALCDAFKDTDYPVFSSWIGTEEVTESKKLFRKAGIPTYDSPERAVKAYLNAYRYEQLRQNALETDALRTDEIDCDADGARTIIQAVRSQGRTLLTEVESKGLLECYGIPATPMKRAGSADEAAAFSAEMGFPVVLKLDSKDITHKSDAGGVKLNLKNEADVREAFEAIVLSAKQYDPNATVNGVTVQPMIDVKGHEVILGAKKDPDFGPVILFGMGGVMAELMQDRAIELPPLNRPLARRLMAKTKVYRLLKGFRGRSGADLERLEEILMRLSKLLEDLPEVVELDINPLLAHETGAFALDARVVVSPS